MRSVFERDGVRAVATADHQRRLTGFAIEISAVSVGIYVKPISHNGCVWEMYARGG